MSWRGTLRYYEALMMHKVVRRILRPDPQTVRLLGGLGVATVHEAQGRTGLMRPYMRPIYTGARLAAPAVTVLCHPADNLMIHAAVEVCEPGDALVVATLSDSTDALFGDLLAASCQAHGITGLVIDAGIRDTADLTIMQFPVWAKVVNAQGPVKATPGSVNVPMSCAGAIVNPGDVVIADADGVVVVRREDAVEVAERAEERRVKEETIRQHFRTGELSVDYLGLRAKLKELGVEYVDE